MSHPSPPDLPPRPLPPEPGPHPGPAYPAPEAGGAGETGLGLRDLLLVLRRNRWLILAATLSTTALAGYLVSQEVTLYRASAFIRLREPANLASLGLASASVPASSPIASEIMVLQGRGVAGEVTDAEGLRLVPATEGLPATLFRDVLVSLPPDARAQVQIGFGAEGVMAELGGQRRRAPYGAPLVLDGVRFTVSRRPVVTSATLSLVPRDLAIDRLIGGLRARQRDGTDGVEVQYSSADSELAIRLANALVRKYQEVNARTARQESQRRRAFLAQQLRETDSLFMAAQTALSQFRSQEQAYSTREKFVAHQSGIMGLEQERDELDADLRMYQTLLRTITVESSGPVSSRAGALLSFPGIAANPAVGQLAQQLASYERSRDSMVVWGRKPEHPAVQRLSEAMERTRATLVEALANQIASLDSRIGALDARRGSNVDALQALSTTESAELRLVQQVETLRSITDRMRQEYEQARIMEAVEAGQVEIVHLASRADPVPSNRAFKLLLGLVLGLAIGGGSAFFRESMNTSIRRRDEIVEALRIAEMGVIPPIRPEQRQPRLARREGESGEERQPRGLVASSAAVAEAYRILRTNLALSPALSPLRTLVITSAASGEGKTTTAINLAASFAQQGARVALVDCDLWRSRLPTALGLAAQPGLTDLLLQRSPPRECLRPTTIEGLDVLPSGTRLEQLSELLSTRRMDVLLGWLREHYHLVVLDTPPVLAISDAVVLSSKADGVLLIVRAGSTERASAQAAIRQLAAVGARVVGGVLNDPDAEVPRYGGQYRGYEREYASEG